MSVDIADIMDAVVATIQATDFGTAVSAQRDYVLPRDLSAISGVQVTVRPASLAIAGIDLSPRLATDWGVAIVVQSRVTPDAASVDPLMGVIQQIPRLFVGRRVGAAARCTHADADPPFDPDRLDTDGLFQSIVTLTIRHTQ